MQDRMGAGQRDRRGWRAPVWDGGREHGVEGVSTAQRWLFWDGGGGSMAEGSGVRWRQGWRGTGWGR